MIQHHKAILIALITLLLALIPTQTLAAGAPRLALTADTTQAAVGREMVIKLMVEDASPTVKVQTSVTFDPLALQIVAVDHGSFLTKNPETDAFVLQNNIDNQAGTIDYAILLNQTQQAAEGSGLLATFTVQVKTNETVALTLQDGYFFSPQGGKIKAATDSIQFMVGGEVETEPAPAAGAASQLVEAAVVSTTQTEPSLNQPATPEEQIQATEPSSPGPAVIDPAATTEHEPLTALRERSPLVRPDRLSPRRFQHQIPSDAGNHRLLALSLLVGLGMIVLSIGLVGSAGAVGGWLWLARVRRRDRQ